MLKRELSKLESYATLVGAMVGAGIFVAIGQAGEDTGPSTFLSYIILGPMTLLTALPYIIFHSTPLGNLSGGAYLHISRTFKRHFPGFITMWLTWITYLGVMSILSVSVGKYLQAFIPGVNPRVVATFCLVLFFVVNLLGVKKYGKWQSTLFFILLASIILLVIPGVMHVRYENFTPFFPKGVSGLLKSLPVLFFAYAGFDALAQTAGETKSASKTLPRIFFRGILISVSIYVAISFVTFGVVPYTELLGSGRPVADAAKTFLPFGSQIVAIGAIAAFLTTINACMMVPSRILYVFAEDRVAPAILAKVNRRFMTPHISLAANVIISIFLVWTHTIGYLISISMQALIILYTTECLAMTFLPIVNKPLWRQVPYKIKAGWVTAAGGLASLLLVGLFAVIPNPFSKILIIWLAIGILFYLYERYMGRKEGFNYSENLAIPMPVVQSITDNVAFNTLQASLDLLTTGSEATLLSSSFKTFQHEEQADSYTDINFDPLWVPTSYPEKKADSFTK